MNDWIGVQELFDMKDFVKLASRLLLNLFFAGMVVHLYTKLYKQDQYRFTYVLFNVITFCLCFLLRKVPIELGFALGLFAVFGILRYRTEPIGIRDLTYLFVVIGIAILNAVSNKKVSLSELLLVNFAIVGMVGVMEWAPFRGRRSSHDVIYDDVELLRSGDEEALLKDLKARTGLEVDGFRVLRYDLLRDTALLTISHKRRKNR